MLPTYGLVCVEVHCVYNIQCCHASPFIVWTIFNIQGAILPVAHLVKHHPPFRVACFFYLLSVRINRVIVSGPHMLQIQCEFNSCFVIPLFVFFDSCYIRFDFYRKCWRWSCCRSFFFSDTNLSKCNLVLSSDICSFSVILGSTFIESVSTTMTMTSGLRWLSQSIMIDWICRTSYCHDAGRE